MAKERDGEWVVRALRGRLIDTLMHVPNYPGTALLVERLQNVHNRVQDVAIIESLEDLLDIHRLIILMTHR